MSGAAENKEYSPVETCCQGKFLIKKMENASIVIIGAGVAGISAAQHLLKKGCQNITILEAGSR